MYPLSTMPHLFFNPMDPPMTRRILGLHVLPLYTCVRKRPFNWEIGGWGVNPVFKKQCFCQKESDIYKLCVIRTKNRSENKNYYPPLFSKLIDRSHKHVSTASLNRCTSYKRYFQHLAAYLFP